MQTTQFLLVAIVFFALSVCVHSLSCGQVFDGPNAGHDRGEQHSTDTIQATWQGFTSGSGSSSVTYEYAIISQNLTTPAILSSGWNAPNPPRCRTTPGFNGFSDVQDFRFGNVGHDTSIHVSDLRLKRKVKYYVIVRATQGGSVTYSNSNGIYVSPEDDDDLHPYQQGLIAMGCAIFCLLCLFYLLLLILLVARGKGDDKYTTTVHRNDNVEKV